jgi:anti-anti-sigma regulatory factor
MLRITVIDETGQLTLKLEGKLKGAWVRELERTFQAVRGQGKPLRADLSAVSFVDDEGKVVLASLWQRGVKMQAIGPLMTAVIEEIAQSPATNARAGPGR